MNVDAVSSSLPEPPPANIDVTPSAVEAAVRSLYEYGYTFTGDTLHPLRLDIKAWGLLCYRGP